MDELFVIRNRKTGKFIGVNQSSGGYPYETDIFSAERMSRYTANGYRQTMHEANWDLYSLIVSDVSVSWNIVSWDGPLIKRSWE